MFMALVDLAVIAAMKAMHALSHYSFKLDLGYEMTLPLVRQRSALPRLSRSIKLAMDMVGIVALTSANNPTAAGDHLQQRQRCRNCLDAGVKDALQMRRVRKGHLHATHQNCLLLF